MLLALMAYGDAHLADPDGPPMRLRHDGCGGEVAVRLECTRGHHLQRDDKLRPAPGPGARRGG